MSAFRHVGDRLVHRGHVWHVAVGTFESPEGESFERDVVRAPGAVAAVPLRADADGRPTVVLVRQYRPAFDEEVIEIPAGMRDVDGEPVVDTIARELVEEVGLRAGSLDPLVQFYPSVGMTDLVLHLFVATDLVATARDLQGPEEQHMEVVEMSLDEALAMIDDGRIRDAKTIIGLLLVARRLASREAATS